MVPSVEWEGKWGRESQVTIASLMEVCLLVFYSLKDLCIQTVPIEQCARQVATTRCRKYYLPNSHRAKCIITQSRTVFKLFKISPFLLLLFDHLL